MWQRALSVSGGGGKFPFSLAEGTSAWNRASITSEDNYIYDDNGTIKVHIDMTFTALSTLSNGYYFAGCVPNMTYGEAVVGSNDFGVRTVFINATYGNVACLYTKRNISQGASFTVQLDYPM